MSTQPTGKDLAPMTEMSAMDSLVLLDPKTISYDEAARVRGSIDHNAVDRIAESIRLTGQAQPITCVAKGDRYVLLDGLHRLLACKKLNITVEAKRLNKTWYNGDNELFDAAIRLMEIDTIIKRAEVTPAMRDRLFAEAIKMADQIAELKGGAVGTTNGGLKGTTNGGPKSRKPSGNSAGAKWFTDAYEAIGMPEQTARNKWKAYLDSVGVEHFPPSRANKQHKDGFSAYLEGNAAEADEKAKAAQEEAIDTALAKLRVAIKIAIADCVGTCGALHPAMMEVLREAEEMARDCI